MHEGPVFQKFETHLEKVLDALRNSINGNINNETLINLLLNMKNQQQQFDSTISDIISIIDVEIGSNNDKQQKEYFNRLVQLLRQIIGDDILKERLEIDTLENIKLITKKENFNQKYIKIKTRLFYKQQKFNLLREESEGYSKLITELNQNLLNKYILQNIQSLIGCFNLDPNRVLDIILESFENNLKNYESYIRLLKEYKSENETICNIIGFKFQFLNMDPLVKLNDLNKTYDSLYKVAAYLLKYGIIELNALIVHLHPNDDDISLLYKEEFELAKQYAKKLTIFNLNSNNDVNKIEQTITTNQNDESTSLQIKEKKNQRVNLIKCLINVEDWNTSLNLIDKLPQWYLATHEDISQTICKILHKIVDPIYLKINSFSTELKKKFFNSIDCNSIEESLFETFNYVALPILCSIGPGVYVDTILFTKLIRICISFIEKKQNNLSLFKSKTFEIFYNNIYTIINEILLPSLSMMNMNSCLAIELWSLLKLFPYEMRYYLYNSWRTKSYTQYPQLIRVKADCEEKIKYLLKRLTKETTKIQGREIGKLSHNNPIIVCDYILTQIQRYDNFIHPIVDSLKFMTPLSYDVLSYCIIMQISDPDKEKMKHDSTTISSWLQSIASFSALVFKKYQIELTAIIQYVINQLKNRKSFDLLILQEIVQKMCGIEISSESTDFQLDAMTGGDLLRQEAGFFNQIRNTKKSSNRLKEALADHNLILPLCILLSQERDHIVFAEKEETEHLKLTGHLYDQCQDSLVQFSQFLSTTLTTEEYIHIFPKIDELVNLYHVSPDVAFLFSRPMYTHHIHSKYDELRKYDKISKTVEKPSKTQRYLEAIDNVMTSVIELVKKLQPVKIWEDMSPLFYTTFWTLSCNDLAIPSVAYDRQRNIIKQKLNLIDENQELTNTKKKKEKERLLGMLDKLSEEENKQKDHISHVKSRLDKEKENWFPQKNKTKNETITEFLQLCIFSRCLFTEIDAIYCAKFIQTIHSLKTPNFSTIICYDRIFSDISYSIASLTENEARIYGRFLLGLLETVMHWHSDFDIFEKECSLYPGFLTVFRNSLNNNHSAPNKQEQLDYENFRHVCHKWHYKLTKSFIVCLESEEYIQIRNALIILKKILPHYPKLNGFCSALDKRVEKIKQNEKDKRQDLHTLGSIYLGQLRQKKPQMLEESKFHLKETPKEKPKSNQNQQISIGQTSNLQEEKLKHSSTLPVVNQNKITNQPKSQLNINNTQINSKQSLNSESQKILKQSDPITKERPITKPMKNNNENIQKSNSGSGSRTSSSVSSKNLNSLNDQKGQSGLKSSKKLIGHNTLSELSVGGEDSIGSFTSDDSPKRSRKSSSRSTSPQNYKNADKAKRIKSDENLKTGNLIVQNADKQPKHKEHEKEKKEHRKRDHSNDLHDSNNQKRSKSDEKKKSSPSSKRESRDDLSNSVLSNSIFIIKSTREHDNRKSPREKR